MSAPSASAAANNKSALVALVDPQLLASGPSASQQPPLPVHRWADPHDGASRLYLTTNQHRLAELQALPRSEEADYASFLVEPHFVVPSPHLYVVSPVDPLFLVLASVPALQETSQQQQWQPLDQLVAGLKTSLSPVVVDCMESQQVVHLCRCLAMDDDTVYYQWDEAQALAWLTRKQEAVQTVLQQQQERRVSQEKEQQQSQTVSNNHHNNGAFDASFRLADDLQAEATTSSKSTVTTKNTAATLERERFHESFQLVCAYLNPHWRALLGRHLSVDADALLAGKKRPDSSKSQTYSQDSSSGGSSSLASSLHIVSASSDDSFPATVNKADKKKKQAPAQSLGVRKLAKVNTSGMKKLTSFFSAAPAKKKAKIATESSAKTATTQAVAPAENAPPNNDDTTKNASHKSE